MLHKKHIKKTETDPTQEETFVPVVDKSKLAAPVEEKPKVVPKKKNITDTIDYFKKMFGDVKVQLDYISASLEQLKKSDAAVHAELPTEDGNFEEMKKQAKKISKEEGVVQHVNKVSDGVYKLDNFYDADQTAISYENGLQL
jgi:hypothetical protein